MINKKQRNLFEQVKSYAYDYMDNAYKRAVFPTEDAINRLDWDERFGKASYGHLSITRKPGSCRIPIKDRIKG